MYEREDEHSIEFGGTYNTVRLFTRDNTAFVLKSDLEADYNDKIRDYPVTFGMTFEQYIQDIKSASSKNSFFMRYVGETKYALMFSLTDGYEPLSKDLFRPVDPDLAFQLKQCAAEMAKSRRMDLRTHSMRHVFFNRLTKAVKVVDFGSVWYTNMSEDNYGLLTVIFEPADVTVFALVDPLSNEQQSIFATIRRDVYKLGYGTNTILKTL